MKKLLLFLGIAFSISSYATVVDTVNQSSEINKVTVFFTGAQISRTSEISLNAGKHIIVLSELPVELNPKSIQVQGISDCQILSVKHDIKHQQKSKDDVEILAIEEASKKLNGWRLTDCDIYVTLEPCLMCSGAIYQSRIVNLFYGATDYKAGAVESILKVLDEPKLNHKVTISSGILDIECSNILSDFFRELRRLKKITK